jgi:phosphatidylserine decarboxylase
MPYEMLAKGSMTWIGFSLILAVLSLFLFLPLAGMYVLIAIFFMIFFRDPERTPSNGIVAPADGKVTKIERGADFVRIITVMNLHNVHVNRAPMDGKVRKITHHPGKHVPAFNKDSENNERVVTLLDTKIGEVKIVQIAGAFARRIEPYISEGQDILKGQRIGIIKFGSRVDLYLPEKRVKVNVKENQGVKAAESTIALET